MFNVGQKVICINDKSTNGYSFPNGIIMGGIYTIKRISNCECGAEILILKEVHRIKKTCSICNRDIEDLQAYYSSRFIPIKPMEYVSLSNRGLKNIRNKKVLSKKL